MRHSSIKHLIEPHVYGFMLQKQVQVVTAGFKTLYYRVTAMSKSVRLETILPRHEIAKALK